MKSKLQTLLIATISLFLMACQGTSPTHGEGHSLAVQYLTAINDGKYDEAYALVSEDFFGSHSKDDRMAYHDEIKNIMGPVVSMKLSTKTVDDRFSGRFYMFRFALKHENGISMEMVTMIDQINSNKPLRVFAHKVDSSKLKKLNANF